MGLYDLKSATKMRMGMVVMTMDTVEVHRVVMEKRMKPIFTSMPTASVKRKYDALFDPRRKLFILSKCLIIRCGMLEVLRRDRSNIQCWH